MCLRATGVHHDFNQQYNIAQMTLWPFNAAPHSRGDPKTYLLTSPATPDFWRRTLPTRAVKRMFTEAFWRTGFAKYGTQSLRLDGERSQVTIRLRYSRHKDLRRAFGRKSVTWMASVRAVAEALEHRPRVVMLSFGDPTPYVDTVRAADVLLMIQATDLDEARQRPRRRTAHRAARPRTWARTSSWRRAPSPAVTEPGAAGPRCR